MADRDASIKSSRAEGMSRLTVKVGIATEDVYKSVNSGLSTSIYAYEKVLSVLAKTQKIPKSTNS